MYNVAMPYQSSMLPLHKRPRNPPPDETFQEAAYLKSLGEKQTQVSVKLLDGQVVKGWIEYYDHKMIRLTREGAVLRSLISVPPQVSLQPSEPLQQQPA